MTVFHGTIVFLFQHTTICKYNGYEPQLDARGSQRYGVCMFSIDCGYGEVKNPQLQSLSHTPIKYESLEYEADFILIVINC